MSLIDPSLLKMLCCPETHQPVTEVDSKFVTELNSRIASGGVKNRAGKGVTDEVEGGLVRQDRQFLYPVRNRIPIMLVEEAIPLAQS